MGRTAVTLRINDEERNALKNLSKIEGRPVNQLLNDAIKIYLKQKGHKERSLEATLNSLKAYRKRDPEFKRALAEFVEAEATLDDPLEGKPAEEDDDGNVTRKPVGPLESKIQSLINSNNNA
jgi:predicted transcriptional regulator